MIKMELDKRILRIYESCNFNPDKKLIKYCHILTYLMKEYTKTYTLEEIRSYIIFIIALFLDFKESYEQIGVPFHQLNEEEKKVVCDLLIYEL
ncbi:MAG: hypothetical protein BAJALOKI2v1_370001 [Promethearchaeota archaeon]|nr:MAG: hypothetical protein BAJALOKI2v1_370001 [Candidatus Lokiarchaeota archaeon]